MEHEKLQKKQSVNDVQMPQNRTGIPDNMKLRFENLSGHSFDDVRVHYNSGKPAQLQSIAYTQGSDVYISPGQERYLGHELGHVIQQKENRIHPEISYRGIGINNNPAFEREADAFAIRAMHLNLQNPAFAERVEASEPSDAPRAVAQMAKWEWNEKSGRWSVISGHSVKGPPQHKGKTDGEIFDDTLSLMPTKMESPPPESEFVFETSYTGDDTLYGEQMEVLQDIELNGGSLTESQKKQRDAWFSNAGFFLRVLKEFRKKPPEGMDEWEEALRTLEGEMGLSVFTRDIDEGELRGQPVSGGTMSVAERMKMGFGRIRNYKDLNRGGGGGSYVRFVAEKKAAGDGESNKLNVGSIASGGVTILYDGVSVVRDNSSPAHIAFNKQDSAGRIFETSADTPQELRQKGRLSQEILARKNPDYTFPFVQRNDVPELTVAYIMENAMRGVKELTRQAKEGQKPKEEYNEAVLFSGAKINSIKAILIHTPVAATGRPPTEVAFKQDQIARQERRAEQQKTQKLQEIHDINEEIMEIDAAVQRIRGTGQIDEVVRLEGVKTILLERKKQALRKKIPKVIESRFVPKPQVSTERTIRSGVTWEGYQVPKALEKWLDCEGYGGVPMKYLFYRINPEKVRRERLPQLANDIWTRGYAAWKEETAVMQKQKILEEKAAEDALLLQVRGTSISKLRTGSASVAQASHNT